MTGGCPTGCGKLEAAGTGGYELCLFCCATGKVGGMAPEPNGKLAQQQQKIISILGDQDCTPGAVVAQARADAIHQALQSMGM